MHQWKFFPWILNRRPISLFTFLPVLHARLSQVTLHNTSRLKLPRLLDDEGTGQVGLLHRGSHLAVPHTHWCLWKFVAQLQKKPKQGGGNHPTRRGKQYGSAAGMNSESKEWSGFFTKKKTEGLRLPCQVFLSEGYQLVASCWRWRGSCCKVTGTKHKESHFQI